MSVNLSTIMQGHFIIKTTVLLIIIFSSTIIFTSNFNTASGDEEFSIGANVEFIDILYNNTIYINDKTIIENKQEIFNKYLIYNTTENITIKRNGKLILDNVYFLLNNSINSTPNIHVLSGGELQINGTTTDVLSEWSNSTGFQIIIEPGAIFKISYSNIKPFYPWNNRSFILIRSNNTLIEHIEFQGVNQVFDFENVSDIEVHDCHFFWITNPVLIKNSNNITFFSCSFVQNTNALKLDGSGGSRSIKLINCTIRENVVSQPKYWEKRPIVILKDSKLAFYNVSTFFYITNYSIEKILVIDNQSQLKIYWSLNLLTVKTKGKPLTEVDVKIMDNFEDEVFKNRTDSKGKLTVFWLLQAKIELNKQLDYNPFKIKAVKNKDEYTGTIYLNLDEVNSSKINLIKLEKSNDNENSLENNLMIFCICGMVIVTVFLIMMSLNMYLARRKLGLNNKIELKPTETGKRTTVFGKDVITCSECGTQVTDDATFCPHCGEYFEGEEVFCPGCNARVKENAASCPKCGRVFESIVKKDKDKNKLFCPVCSAVIDAKDLKCPACGSVLNDEKSKKKVKKVKEKRSSEKTTPDSEIADVLNGSFMCSICGAEVSEKTKVCPKCKTELE